MTTPRARTFAGGARTSRLTPREERALKSIHAAEQAGRPSRVDVSVLQVLTARGMIYVVEFVEPRRRFAHLTADGCLVLGVEIGDRK